jgi:hypothetical protein
VWATQNDFLRVLRASVVNYQKRNFRMQKILFIIALAAGLAIAFIDSRPAWDDTALTVAALLVAGGIIGLLARRRPWLYALLLGAWLPLWEGFTSRNFSILVVLVFPFAGVYAGWALGNILRKSQIP